MENDLMCFKNKGLVDIPRVAVFLAAFNGTDYLREQLESIFSQVNVDVTVYISVDTSTDGTENLIDQLTKNYSRLIALPYWRVFGSAAPNFFRLICEVDFRNFDFVSFADQDDIWMPQKLSNHIGIAKMYSADGVSSNVMAYWSDGRTKLLDKAQRQKEFDYLFESAGPGCTFLMTPWLVNQLRYVLLDDTNPARYLALHDWLAYAVCRAHGRKWVIDSTPSVQYRQHQHNVLGANVGLKAKLARLDKLKQGWYKSEVIKIIEICQRITPNPNVLKIATSVKSGGFIANIRLLAFLPQARRGFVDRLLLGFCILVGLL